MVGMSQREKKRKGKAPAGSKGNGRAGTSNGAGAHDLEDAVTCGTSMQRHALLQALMQRKCITLAEALDLCSAIVGAGADLSSMISRINSDIQVSNLKIKTSEVPLAGSKEPPTYVALVITVADDAAKQFTVFSFVEMAYLKCIVSVAKTCRVATGRLHRD